MVDGDQNHTVSDSHFHDIQRQLVRIEQSLAGIHAWKDKHDSMHTDMRVGVEHRLTKLEGAVTMRTWIGGVAAGVLGYLGVRPSP